MERFDNFSQIFQKRWLLLILWGVIFALAYAPAPLYTSNQNQYFLEGLARAGYGNLGDDWLVQTQTATPVFSFLIYAVYTLTHWEGMFYILYGVLAAVFIISLYAIGMKVFHFSDHWRWIFLMFMVVINSAALRFIIVRVLGVNWVYLLDGGVAGQRVLGEVLQPSAFGVFLLASVACFLNNRPGWAVLLLISAAVMHPTYLISAALLTLIYILLVYSTRRNWQLSVMIGIVVLIGVLPIVVHTFSTFTGADAETVKQAREILVNYRIPHHAIPSEWVNGSEFAKLGFVAVALWILLRGERRIEFSVHRQLFQIIFWPSVFAVLMTSLVAVTENQFLALLFPWRVSVILVPLAVMVLTGFSLGWLIDRFELDHRIPGKILIISSLLIGALFASAGLAKTYRDYQERIQATDRPMMAYVESHKQPGDVYVIPLKMQDFRLETGAAAYTEFKSIPYQSEDVLEWYHRVLMASRVYRLSGEEVDCGHFDVLYMEARITHVVLPTDHMGYTCDRLVPVYQDEDYSLYRYSSPSDL